MQSWTTHLKAVSFKRSACPVSMWQKRVIQSVWAHCPALGDSQDLSEAGSLAARGGRLWRVSHHLIITAAHWKKSRAEIGQIWKGWDATPFSANLTKLKAAHVQMLVLPLTLSLQESQRQNSKRVPGHRREQWALKTLKKKFSPSADLKCHFRQLH